MPSWADCFESKAVWYWTSQGCTETCFTASRPWWYWKDCASIETGKKKKNRKCCHVTDLGAEPLFVFLWVRRRKIVIKAWTFWTSESRSWLSNWFSESRGAKKIIFTSCYSGKLKPAFTSPDVISTSPKSFLTSRINFTFLLLIPQKTSLALRAR